MYKYSLILLLCLGLSSASLAQTQAPSSSQPEAATAAASPEAPADVEAFVKTQTKGGELDFNKKLASRKQSMFLHDGEMYTKQEYALVLWGMRVKSLGLASAERACALYASINNRPLSTTEQKAVTNGFASGSGE
jgi:hypothetical protein